MKKLLLCWLVVPTALCAGGGDPEGEYMTINNGPQDEGEYMTTVEAPQGFQTNAEIAAKEGSGNGGSQPTANNPIGSTTATDGDGFIEGAYVPLPAPEKPIVGAGDNSGYIVTSRVPSTTRAAGINRSLSFMADSLEENMTQLEATEAALEKSSQESSTSWGRFKTKSWQEIWNIIFGLKTSQTRDVITSMNTALDTASDQLYTLRNISFTRPLTPEEQQVVQYMYNCIEFINKKLSADYSYHANRRGLSSKGNNARKVVNALLQKSDNDLELAQKYNKEIEQNSRNQLTESESII